MLSDLHLKFSFIKQIYYVDFLNIHGKLLLRWPGSFIHSLCTCGCEKCVFLSLYMHVDLVIIIRNDQYNVAPSVGAVD